MGREHMFLFKYDPSYAVDSSEVFVDEDEPVEVLEHVCFARGFHVFADTEPLDFWRYFARCPPLPPAKPHQARDGGLGPARAFGPPNRPYLRTLEEKRDPAPRKLRRRLAREKADSSSSSDDEKKTEMTHEEKQQVKDYMAAYRAEFAARYPDLNDDFNIAPRGAPSNIEKKHIVFDCIRSEAQSNLAKTFCAHFGLPYTYDGFFHPHGRDEARILAHAHSQKMIYLFGLWVHEDQAPIDFTSEMVEEWPPPAEFKDLLARPGLLAATRRRCTIITELRPKEWAPAAWVRGNWRRDE